MKKIFPLLASVFLLLGCSKNDDAVISPPELSVSSILSASFFQHGESPMPEVQWNGSQGKFGLENTLQGLSLNSETGQLSWNSSLPLGVHTVTLFAYNEAGKDLASLTINNQFQGTFRGSFQSNSTFTSVLFKVMEIVFKADGTFQGYGQSELDSGEILGPNYFKGNYTLIENKMEGTLQYDGGSVNPFEAVLNHNGQLAKLTGSYSIKSFLNLTTTFELNYLIEL